VSPALERDLRRALRGEVLFDEGERALYATDASNYRKVPIGIVRPRDAADAVAALEVCAAHGAPILPRGGGTSLAGQCCNVAVVFDFSRHMNRLVSLDPERRVAVVEPGLVLDDLRTAAKAHGLTFAPDPSTHGWCTLGGMIGNNSCGIHSVYGGRTADNVEELEIAAADGTRMRVRDYPRDPPDGPLGVIVSELRALRDEVADLVRARYPRIPRRISGYNLDELLPERGFHVARSLVGTEGTCVLVTRATVRLLPWPKRRILVVLGYPDIVAAADDVPSVLAFRPLGLEAIDREVVDGIRAKRMPADPSLLPDGDGWLLVELGGDDADDRAAALTEGRPPGGARIVTDAHEQEDLWKVRESGLGATARIPGRPDTWEGWEDAAVPPDRLGDYLRGFRALLARYGYHHASTYGHFGDGCVHTRIPFDLRTDPGIARFRAFVGEAADLVVAHGGSLSGEHGDGQSRAELLEKMYGAELVGAFRRFKRVWDPDGRMNPGHVVDPYPITANLRVAHVATNAPATVFQYPDDDGSLHRATERCVGIGMCRRRSVGTMCPSYMATREERHSTRGRAHLLYEMMRADSPVASARFESRAVHDALDLCLSCKGCKRDCPMQVDIATYKAEFTHRWYRFRLRPRIAYTFGLVPWTARLLAAAPRVVNAITRSWIVRRALGVHPDRAIPRFADRSFRARFRDRPAAMQAGEPVLLWADTWTDRFHPEVGIAAVDALEALGFRVSVLPRPVCCGRPLYDYGMLGPARRALRTSIAATRATVDSGAKIVMLEPSCASVFRDELPNLMPGDSDARRFSSSVVTLAELIATRRPDAALSLPRDVLFHAHCHHKAVLGTGADVGVLRRAGAVVEPLDVGCCGMSGLFGYEHHKYETSKAIGENGVLPAVRNAPADTIVCADGFSCRTQIADLTGRRPMHLAEILRDALTPGRRPA